MSLQEQKEPAASPPSLAGVVGSILEARGDSTALRRIVNSSPFPIVTLDRGQRYTHANRPARLLLRKSLGELLELTVEDVTAPDLLPVWRKTWEDLLARGSVSNDQEVRFRDGTSIDLTYWAIAEPSPGEYLFVVVPAGWPEDELRRVSEADSDGRSERLTQRELEVLRLAAEGSSARGIAERLVIAESTVKTHLANSYAKLGASDRAAAVAQAMRLGLIS